ncbi:uncharacterized protein METZ01_LOCUS323121 [marine metagenome]|uniref:Uncharacterized protein n=1 Tax=marine metagenome TaxID=408172 RepID=A0A382PBN9_9ZZZZ
MSFVQTGRWENLLYLVTEKTGLPNRNLFMFLPTKLIRIRGKISWFYLAACRAMILNLT